MRPKLKLEDQMTIEAFLSFTDTRPDEERWELIERVPVISGSPTKWHQIIAANFVAALGAVRLEQRASWIVALGVGTRVPLSPYSPPQPDVMVFENPVRDSGAISDDAIVLFEVLSKSNTKLDQAWQRRAYANIPNCQHYVTAMPSSIAVTRYDRADGWRGVELTSLGDHIPLLALGRRAKLALGEIYRSTPLAPSASPKRR